jgi:hypothetical protein
MIIMIQINEFLAASDQLIDDLSYIFFFTHNIYLGHNTNDNTPISFMTNAIVNILATQDPLYIKILACIFTKDSSSEPKYYFGVQGEPLVWSSRSAK